MIYKYLDQSLTITSVQRHVLIKYFDILQFFEQNGLKLFSLLPIQGFTMCRFATISPHIYIFTDFHSLFLNSISVSISCYKDFKAYVKKVYGVRINRFFDTDKFARGNKEFQGTFTTDGKSLSIHMKRPKR